MLAEAIYTPPGTPAPPRHIIRHPPLSFYAEGWGRAHDAGFIAIDANKCVPVGAAWMRMFSKERPGYGFVSESIPELSIAVKQSYRGRGIGTRLMIKLIGLAQAEYPAICLSVATENPAVRLYKRLGFRQLKENGSLIMLLSFPNHNTADF